MAAGSFTQRNGLPSSPVRASGSNDTTDLDDDDGGAEAVVHGLPCMSDANYATSYTWHSAGLYEASGSGSNGSSQAKTSWRDAAVEGGFVDTADAFKEAEPQEQWILGIDEAGRGPVLGPQVYGAAYCPASCTSLLKEMGFADSKALTDVQRTRLMQRILDGEPEGSTLHYAVTVMHPQDISAGMLQRTNYSLNAQSQDVTVRLIREVIERGYPLTHIFVDPVGPHELYAAKLSAIFPGIQFTVVPKADALFPVVSAASVVAKVTRDTFMEEWQFRPNEARASALDNNFGSGYPSDPRTVAWLERNFNSVFGFPSIARQSWGTVRQFYDRKGCRIKWCEDESANSIRSYFQSNRPGEDKERPALLKEMSLSSVMAI